MRHFIMRAVESRDESLVRVLRSIWERSVRATHAFLTDAEIISIAACIPGYIAAVPHLVVAFDADDRPLAFLGVGGRRIEMLFADVRGCGLGRQLVGYAVRVFSADRVCVNEQNRRHGDFTNTWDSALNAARSGTNRGGPFLCCTYGLGRGSERSGGGRKTPI